MNALSHFSARLFQLTADLLPRRAFLACGCLGAFLGAPLAMWLALHRGLSLRVEAAMIAIAVSMLLLTPLAVKVVTGRDGFVFYRDVICIFVAVSAMLRWLHEPLLPYLDVTVAGAAVFHACGRIGCLLVGCCHGRPARWGMRYNKKHEELGFPSYLVGVPLFPIQALESTLILCLTSVAIIFILGKHPPGTAFALYVTSYAFGRFFLEFARGDADRPYFLSFSQAQWISVLLVIGTTLAARTGILPATRWPLITTAGIAICMWRVTLWRLLDSTGKFKLFHPHHLQEIGRGLERLATFYGSPKSDRNGAIDVVKTSLGILISAGEIVKHGQRLQHYCLSQADRPLQSKPARALGSQIALLEPGCARFDVIGGNAGIFHVLLLKR